MGPSGGGGGEGVREGFYCSILPGEGGGENGFAFLFSSVFIMARSVNSGGGGGEGVSGGGRESGRGRGCFARLPFISFV